MEAYMTKYLIREICPSDYTQATEIYNSNRQFLLNHLGVEFVDEAFVAREVLTMSKVGFCSCVIVDREKHTIVGVLDYKADEEIYLSLLQMSI